MNKKLQRLAEIAEEHDWNVTVNKDDIELQTYSDTGQDFNICLQPNPFDHKHTIQSLRSYIEGFDPVEEALKWTGPDGHGAKGAPYEFSDIVTDMQQCLEEMQTLLEAWTDDRHPGVELPLLTIKEITAKAKELIDSKYSKFYGPFGIAPQEAEKAEKGSLLDFDETWKDDPLYLTKITNPTGTAILISWRFKTDFTKGYVLPEDIFNSGIDYAEEAVYTFLCSKA